MDKTEDGLEACPFCGEIPVEEGKSDDLRIRCENCGVQGPIFPFNPDDEEDIEAASKLAKDHWNRRAALQGKEGKDPLPAMLALEGLTPGGSEYVGDIPRCVEYVRDVINSKHQMIIKLMREKKAGKEGKDPLPGLVGELFPMGTEKLLGSILGPLEDYEDPRMGVDRPSAVVNAEVVIGQILADKACMKREPLPEPESPQGSRAVPGEGSPSFDPNCVICNPKREES